MKTTRKVLTLVLAVLMLASVLPLNAFAASYAVYLNCGPEGWGSTAWPLTKTSGTALPLLHTKQEIFETYGMLPGKQVLDDQRTFIEWNTAYNATTGRGTGTAYYDYYTADKSVTLYAIWGYNIQFNADGGTYPNPTSGNDIYLTYVAGYNLQDQTDPKTDYSYCMPDVFGNTPTKAGCRRVDSSGRPAYALLEKDLTFFCWETPDQNLTIPPTGGYMEWAYFHCADTAKEGNAPEFFAIWEPSVTYNANGGSGSMSTDYLSWTGDALWDYESYTAKSCKFTKSGATFKGWNTKADGTGTSVAVGTQLGGQKNNSDPITLYAQWSDSSTPSTPTYTITFDANGGTLSGTTTYSIKTGATYQSVIGSTMPTPTRSGYTFNGWYNEKYGYTLNLSDTFSVSENITFKAQWTKNADPEPETKDWTITFDPNGGTMVGATTYGINTGDVYSDVIGSMPQATRSGYTLSSWYNEKYGYTLNMSDYFAVSEDVTFKAQWTKTETPVTYSTGVYKDDTGIAMRSSASSSAAINFTVPANTQITVTSVSGSWGYCQYSSYTGWVYLPDLTYVSTTANAKYVLTFDPNGGSMPSGYTTTYYFTPDAKFVDVIGGFPVPVRNGYSFDGWRRVDWTQDMWSDSFGTQPYTFGHDVTLKAEWTQVAHTHSYTSTVTKAATCTEAGVRTYRCSCGDSYTEAIAALGHSYDDGTVTKEPGCVTEGYITYKCEACGNTYNEIIPATGNHDYSTTVTDPDCDSEGKIVYTCAACGDSYEESIPATGSHDYELTVTDPSCVKDGKNVYTCSVCGNSYEEVIPATGVHDYGYTVVDPTCANDGKTVYTCIVCGDSYEEVIPATGDHQYQIVEMEYADCTNDGYIKYQCDACGDTYEETLPSDGQHDYVLLGEKAPTCSNPGSIAYICNDCYDVYEETVPATGHTWGEWVETTAPTTSSNGVETRTCSACGATETQDIPMLNADAPVVADVFNYTVTINGIKDIKEIRFAIGNYTTGSEIKAAEQNVTLDAATVAKYTVDGVFTYDLPWVGEYTFWVRANDGSSYFLYEYVGNINPYVTSYGVKLTVNDFGENYKDAWLAKGTFNTYNEIKYSTDFKYQASKTKLDNYAKTTHDFTYTMEDPGDYTVLIRYNDGSFDVIHHTLTVDYPVLVENGLQVIVQNIPDIKIIRTAYGHYTSVADIKEAPTVRYFNNKTAIKDAEEYMIQYREEGEVTVIVEYNNGYKHYFYYNVTKKVPTYILEGDTITFGNLDDLYIIRYAPGKYTTSNNIKNAPGAQYKKTADINENGEIVISGLTTGRWSFMVQYNDDSYNFYVLDVE